MRRPQVVSLRNYYLAGFFSEAAIMKWGAIIAFALILGSFAGLVL
jgi:hypothetical protein